MKALTILAFVALVAFAAGFGLTSLLGSPKPVPTKPRPILACTADSVVVVPPAGVDGMKLKTVITCK